MFKCEICNKQTKPREKLHRRFVTFFSKNRTFEIAKKINACSECEEAKRSFVIIEGCTK